MRFSWNIGAGVDSLEHSTLIQPSQPVVGGAKAVGWYKVEAARLAFTLLMSTGYFVSRSFRMIDCNTTNCFNLRCIVNALF